MSDKTFKVELNLTEKEKDLLADALGDLHDNQPLGPAFRYAESAALQVKLETAWNKSQIDSGNRQPVVTDELRVIMANNFDSGLKFRQQQNWGVYQPFSTEPFGTVETMLENFPIKFD